MFNKNNSNDSNLSDDKKLILNQINEFRSEFKLFIEKMLGSGAELCKKCKELKELEMSKSKIIEDMEKDKTIILKSIEDAKKSEAEFIKTIGDIERKDAKYCKKKKFFMDLETIKGMEDSKEKLSKAVTDMEKRRRDLYEKATNMGSKPLDSEIIKHIGERIKNLMEAISCINANEAKLCVKEKALNDLKILDSKLYDLNIIRKKVSTSYDNFMMAIRFIDRLSSNAGDFNTNSSSSSSSSSNSSSSSSIVVSPNNSVEGDVTKLLTWIVTTILSIEFNKFFESLQCLIPIGANSVNKYGEVVSIVDDVRIASRETMSTFDSQLSQPFQFIMKIPLLLQTIDNTLTKLAEKGGGYGDIRAKFHAMKVDIENKVAVANDASKGVATNVSNKPSSPRHRKNSTAEKIDLKKAGRNRSQSCSNVGKFNRSTIDLIRIEKKFDTDINPTYTSNSNNDDRKFSKTNNSSLNNSSSSSSSSNTSKNNANGSSSISSSGNSNSSDSDEQRLSSDELVDVNNSCHAGKDAFEKETKKTEPPIEHRGRSTSSETKKIAVAQGISFAGVNTFYNEARPPRPAKPFHLSSPTVATAPITSATSSNNVSSSSNPQKLSTSRGIKITSATAPAAHTTPAPISITTTKLVRHNTQPPSRAGVSSNSCSSEAPKKVTSSVHKFTPFVLVGTSRVLSTPHAATAESSGNQGGNVVTKGNGM
jgi:hypothetical protein